MATLHIVGLTCIHTTAEARDEPYLVCEADSRRQKLENHLLGSMISRS